MTTKDFIRAVWPLIPKIIKKKATKEMIVIYWEPESKTSHRSMIPLNAPIGAVRAEILSSMTRHGFDCAEIARIKTKADEKKCEVIENVVNWTFKTN